MSDISKQLHSLTFTNDDDESKNTWDDWHLVPSSRPVLNPPSTKTYDEDIPGANGKIDLTEALTGYPSYNNRTGSLEFVVMHQGLDTSLGDPYGYLNTSNSGWQGVFTEISNFIHGQSMKVESEDYPDWYFKGRMSVNKWKSDQTASTITLDYDLEPFRYSATDTSDMWKWDPFNFKTGIIHTYSGLSLGSSTKVIGTVIPVVPTVFVTSSCNLTTKDGTFKMNAGMNKNPLIIVYPGEQTWTFTGSGSAAIYFRERSL